MKVTDKLEDSKDKVVIKLIIANGNTSKSRDLTVFKKIAEKVDGNDRFLLYHDTSKQPKPSTNREQISPTGSLKAAFRDIKYTEGRNEGKIIKAYLVIADMEHIKEIENAIKEFGFKKLLQFNNRKIILKNNNKLIILVFLGEKLCLEEQILHYLRITNKIKNIERLNQVKNCKEIKDIINKNKELRRFFSNFENTLEELIKELKKDFFPQIWEAIEFIEEQFTQK